MLYKQITSAKVTVDLSIGFDRDHGRTQKKLTNNNNQRANYHVKFLLRDVSGLAEYHEKSTYVSEYILTLTRKKTNAILNRATATANVKIKISAIDWYLPHYTPWMEQRGITSEQVLGRTPTKLRYLKITVFTKVVYTQNLWIFELGCHEGFIVPTRIFVGFQRKDKLHFHTVNNDIFQRLLVTSVQFIIGAKISWFWLIIES